MLFRSRGSGAYLGSFGFVGVQPLQTGLAAASHTEASQQGIGAVQRSVSEEAVPQLEVTRQFQVRIQTTPRSLPQAAAPEGTLLLDPAVIEGSVMLLGFSTVALFKYSEYHSSCPASKPSLTK